MNQIIRIDDNHKYIILQQVIYQDQNYFMAARLTPDEENITEEFNLLHEIQKDNESYIERVTDPDLARLLLRYMQTDETNK